MNRKTVFTALLTVTLCSTAQPRQHQQPAVFTTDTVMAHDPVMAFENGKYYLLATGMGISWATSTDRKTWTVHRTPFLKEIPVWTKDSVPGFRHHVWAPDIVRHKEQWWLAYSCSTFGKNTSAIGLMKADHLDGPWKDCGPLVCSGENSRWNAIDPNFVIDEKGIPWLTWGSFWDGIQIARLDSTLHLVSAPQTIARRYAKNAVNVSPNPTSKFAGTNAIEAPFIFRHDGYYYLFVSWDYCCRGSNSNYRVAVGRSKYVGGPYLDRQGTPMQQGGGTLVLVGDKKENEAVGHCAVYSFGGKDIFICHGYSTRKNGAALLLQKEIKWSKDGWPKLE
jgi:arabinan endo-1,5-alpha-L-arabinosidase